MCLTPSKPFVYDGFLLQTKTRISLSNNRPHIQMGRLPNERDQLTMTSITPLSIISLGTATPFATAARTVSSTPDARGLPSSRMGLPSMYFEIFESSGSRTWFHDAAAAEKGAQSSFQPVCVRGDGTAGVPRANPISRISSRLHAPVFPNRFSCTAFL